MITKDYMDYSRKRTGSKAIPQLILEVSSVLSVILWGHYSEQLFLVWSPQVGCADLAC